MDAKSLTVIEPEPVSKNADVRELLAEWHSYLNLLVRTGEIQAATSQTYRIGVDRFMLWLENRSTIGTEIIRQWIADMREHNRTPNTVAVWLSGVRAFFSWCVRNRKLSFNPAEGVRGIKRGSTSIMHKREALTDSEVIAVLDAIDRETAIGKRDIALIGIMAYCGARQSDLFRANLEDLKPIDNGFKLFVRGKGRIESAEVLMLVHPQLVDFVRNYLVIRGSESGPLFLSFSHRNRNERLSMRGMRQIVKSYYRKAGVIGKKSTHSLRHAAASNSLRHGAPLEKVKSMLRHASLDTTMIYIHELDRETNPAEGYIDYEKKD
jgi:site-specific recombinase XerD